eukprot:1996399-Rhodomonas_salina.1
MHTVEAHSTEGIIAGLRCNTTRFTLLAPPRPPLPRGPSNSSSSTVVCAGPVINCNTPIGHASEVILHAEITSANPRAAPGRAAVDSHDLVSQLHLPALCPPFSQPRYKGVVGKPEVDA